MKAMILAAGRGERMRPLTDACPKPLLAVGGRPLIVWHLMRLAAAGFHDVVINHAHLGQMLVDRLGDGDAYGLSISWSGEPPGALGTAGGIAQALPLLGEAPFLVVNGDIFCDWDLRRSRPIAAAMREGGDLAHLVMVNNPPHHPQGDFVLEQGRVHEPAARPEAARLTFSGIGIYRPELFSALVPGMQEQLAPQLRRAMRQGSAGGECHGGAWHDVGTPERLRELERLLACGGHAAFAAPLLAGGI